MDVEISSKPLECELLREKDGTLIGMSVLCSSLLLFNDTADKSNPPSSPGEVSYRPSSDGDGCSVVGGTSGNGRFEYRRKNFAVLFSDLLVGFCDVAYCK